MPGTIRSMTMAFRGDISGLDASCRAGAQRLRQFSEESKQINADLRRYNQVLRSRGDQLSEPARAGLQARVSGLEERKATLAEAQAARAGLAQRLADYKVAQQAQLDTKRKAELETLKAQQQAAAEAVKIEQQMQAARTEAAWAAVRKRMAAEQGGAGGSGVGGRAGGFGPLGSKREVRHELKYAMAMAAGHGGEELGLLSQAMVVGGVAGAVMAGVAAVGSVYEHTKKHAAELAEKQERHKDATRESVQWMNRLAESYIHTTHAGSSFRERAEEERKAAEGLYKESMKKQREMGLLETGAVLIDSLMSGGIENTNYGKGVKEDIAEYQQRLNRRKTLLGWASEEREIESKNRVETAAAATEQARLAGMASGPERQRLELAARQHEEARRFDTETDEAKRMFGRAKTPTSEVNKWVEQRNREAAEVQKRFGYEQAGLKQEEARNSRREEQSAIEAEIEVRTEGYTRERALLRAKHAFEMQDAQEAGRSTVNLARQQAAQVEALRQKQMQFAIDARKSRETAGDDWSVLFGGMTPLQAARRRVEREHPGADQMFINSAAQSAEDQRLMHVLGGPLSNLMGPMQQYNNFVKDLSSAGGREMLGQAAKALGVSQDEVMRRAKVAELEKLVGRQQTGQMVDFASGRWQSMQSGVLSKQDVFAEQLEKLRGILTNLDTINRNGVTVKR